MPKPKDPLLNQTLVTAVNGRIESLVPEAYRLRAQGSGVVLQGAYKSWNDQGMVFHEWRDIPTVTED